jgi:hypothetical protein
MNDGFGIREVFPDRRTTPASSWQGKKNTEFLNAVLWFISQRIHIVEH